jgi:hypothetical protein
MMVPAMPVRDAAPRLHVPAGLAATGVRLFDGLQQASRLQRLDDELDISGGRFRAGAFMHPAAQDEARNLPLQQAT